MSKQNLVREGKPDNAIYVTGNTVIDALSTTVKDDYAHPEIDWAQGSRLILLTAHRRENLGTPMMLMKSTVQGYYLNASDTLYLKTAKVTE